MFIISTNTGTRLKAFCIGCALEFNGEICLKNLAVGTLFLDVLTSGQRRGVFQKLFQSISSENDPEWLFIDGSIVKAHQDSSGAASGADEAIGKSRGGNSTKIHLAVDSGGLPVYFEISGGQVHDIAHAQSLIAEAPKSSHVTADKGYDSDSLRAFIEAQGCVVNIPRKENSKTGNGHMDWCLYKYRHLVENAFLKIKKYRAIATRYDKLARN